MAFNENGTNLNGVAALPGDLLSYDDLEDLMTKLQLLPLGVQELG